GPAARLRDHGGRVRPRHARAEVRALRQARRTTRRAGQAALLGSLPRRIQGDGRRRRREFPHALRPGIRRGLRRTGPASQASPPRAVGSVRMRLSCFTTAFLCVLCALATVGCKSKPPKPPPPPVVNLSLQAKPDVNPGPDGKASPI